MTEKQKYHKKIYICNVSGGHGHFLTWLLDKCCKTTPDISTEPFDAIGRSHKEYTSSGKFIFIDTPQYEEMVKTMTNENIILITIDKEILYFERICINRSGRSGEANTNLFNESEIEEFLRNNNSTFPDFCKNKNISIQEGYKYAFKFLNQNGAIKLDTRRKEFPALLKNNVTFFPLKNYFNFDLFSNAIENIAKKFSIEVDINACKEVYDIFYKSNKVLQSHNNVYEYINGNKSIKLDVLQQAYVDAQQ